MKCTNCKTILNDGAKFCNECGKKVSKNIECPDCNTKNQLNSKFCKQCGKDLINRNSNKIDIVVLGNEFILNFNKIYYGSLLKRIELFNDAVDPHTSVRTMDSKILENEYRLSIKKCFDYLSSSVKNEVSKGEIEFIREKEKIFISVESNTLFLLLSELTILTSSVIEKVSNSTTEGIIKGLKAGAASAAAGSIIPGVGTVIGGIFGVAAGWIVGDKIDKEEEHILNSWNNQYRLVLEEYDSLWSSLTEILDEIAENTSIHFEIDENVFEEDEEKSINPFQFIIESNLQNLTDEADNIIFYFHSDIPAKKKKGAKDSYVNLDEDEYIICLYDSTLFGGAKEGICLTTKAIYWKEIAEDGKFIGYADIEKTTLKENQLYINGEKVESCACVKELKKTLDEITKSMKN